MARSLPPSIFPTAAWDGINPNREGVDYDAAPDAEDYWQLVAEINALQSPLSELESAIEGITTSNLAEQVIRTTIRLENVVVNMTDAGASGAHGYTHIFNFPEAHIRLIGINGGFTIQAGSGGISDDAGVRYAIGSAQVGTNNVTLTGTEADIMPSTDATLTGGAATSHVFSALSNMLDGVENPSIEAHLNFTVPNPDSSSANDTLTINGTIILSWINLGGSL